MSFDLFFYKKKNAVISRQEISEYLLNNPSISNEHNSDSWWYENSDTEVYFSFESNSPNSAQEEAEGFEGFEDAGFSFNINYLRPDFFGKEAFPVVARFLRDLDLFVFNPQIGATSDGPHQPSPEILYKCWSDFNYQLSREHYNTDTCFYPMDQANRSWNYNYHRRQLQQRLGDAYFVPRIFYFMEKESGKAITVATWTEHIPTIIPVADYYFICKKQVGFLRKSNHWALSHMKRYIKHSEIFSSDILLKIAASSILRTQH